MRNIFKISLIALLAVFSSCEKDEIIQKNIEAVGTNTQTPNNPTPPATPPTEEKKELEFSKVEFIFTEGHTHGLSFHGNPRYEDFAGGKDSLPELKYAKTEQKIIFELEDNKWVRSGDERIRWRQSGIYGMEVVFYNDKGERVNQEFVNEADSHQLFYNFTNIKRIDGRTDVPSEEKIAKFIYRDTNPEDRYHGGRNSAAALANNQLGLKGFFAGDIAEQATGGTGGILEVYLSFDLKVTLAHFVGNSKKKDGKFRDWNEFPKSDIAKAELELEFPVVIFTDLLLEDKDWDKAVQDWVKEYNLTTDEVEEELENRGVLKTKIDVESSTVWM